MEWNYCAKLCLSMIIFAPGVVMLAVAAVWALVRSIQIAVAATDLTPRLPNHPAPPPTGLV